MKQKSITHVKITIKNFYYFPSQFMQCILLFYNLSTLFLFFSILIIVSNNIKSRDICNTSEFPPVLYDFDFFKRSKIQECYSIILHKQFKSTVYLDERKN